jgi:peptide chain release factor 2
MDSIINVLNTIQTQIDGIIQRLNIAEKSERIAEIEQISADPAFWNDPETAQKLMQEMSSLKAEVDTWLPVANRINDALELAQLDDEDLQEELASETEALQALLERMSLQAMLSGQHDKADAIFSIHAGAGGTDSQDWAAMLERMYLRWAEQNGYKVTILDRSEGEEAGIKSVMMEVKGNLAFGYLQSEQGVHRLVRLSPFDSASRRHTSFAKVELWPDIQDDIDIDINENDLRIDAYRAGGAGGQHVQKNDTAIRITHIPSGIVVQCQNERSQKQNRERAMQILKARLYEMERLKKEAELSSLKGENVDAGWGNQIRSYVLHPYHMVKDHRTDYEDGNTAAVLDGRLSPFMDAYLRSKINN